MLLRVGDIIHVSGLPIYKNKGKFCVVAAKGPLLLLLINTDNRQDYDCIPLLKNGREFPRYDSYIGCRNIFHAELSQIDSHHGQLDNEELRALADKISSSRFISKIQKAPILTAINEELNRRKAL